jgi:hypothetical protein
MTTVGSCRSGPGARARAVVDGAGAARAHPSAPPVEGLAKYEGGDLDDDYRHRMVVNFAALLVTVLLTLAGIWLVIQLAELRKNQDWSSPAGAIARPSRSTLPSVEDAILARRGSGAIRRERR